MNEVTRQFLSEIVAIKSLLLQSGAFAVTGGAFEERCQSQQGFQRAADDVRNYEILAQKPEFEAAIQGIQRFFIELIMNSVQFN